MPISKISGLGLAPYAKVRCLLLFGVGSMQHSPNMSSDATHVVATRVYFFLVAAPLVVVVGAFIRFVVLGGPNELTLMLLSLGLCVSFALTIIFVANLVGLQTLTRAQSAGLWAIFVPVLLATTVAAYKTRLLPDVVVVQPPVRADLSPRFFHNSPDFFDEIRREHIPQKAENASAAKIVYLHYIRDDYQVGFREYVNLRRINQSQPGRVPFVVIASNVPVTNPIDLIEWSPSLGPSGRKLFYDKKSNSFSYVIERDGLNAFTYKFFNDPKRHGDWFNIPLSQFYSESHRDVGEIVDYVIVKNGDSKFWNPNKWVFDIAPDDTLAFSPAVYVSASVLPAASLREATDMLKAFLRRDCKADVSRPYECDNYRDVSAKVKEIFSATGFKNDVTIFEYRTTASKNDLVLIYKFCREDGERACP